jgi:tetratricopeptide (TPR) repeat protein
MTGRNFILAGTVAVITVFLYAPSLRCGFINYDDPAYVTRNAHVLRGLSWSNTVWSFSSTVEANWHPVTWLSHMADVQLFALNPAGHHFSNLLLHLCNALLVFWLLVGATNSPVPSAVVAALFAVHPLNVESVAWIAERKTLLCTFFLFWAFWAWFRYVISRSLGFYLLATAFFALSLMSKPMSVTFPALLLFADYWPFNRIGEKENQLSRQLFTKLLVEKIPLFALSFGSALITILAQRSGGALGNTIALPLSERFENAIYSYGIYLYKTLWPTRLAVFYPHPENQISGWKVFAVATALTGITVMVYRYRARKYLVAGWGWFLCSLVPVIGIVQVGRQGWADRYAYIPCLGIFVIATWLVAGMVSKLRISSTVAAIFAAGVIFTYGSVSHRQLEYWRNSYTLFQHALEVTPDNAIAEENFGAALVEIGRADLAASHFEAAIRITPTLSTPHYDLGVLLQKAGQLDHARREYATALQVASDPDEIAQIHNNLGAIFLRQGKLAEAEAEFTAALKANPDEANSLIGRGMAEFQQNALDAAFLDFHQASRVNSSAVAWYWMARVLETQGKAGEAILAYGQALKLSPDFREAQVKLDSLRSASH